MRVNFKKLVEVTGISYVKKSIKDITLKDWEEFQKLLAPTISEKQTSLF